MSRDTRTDKKGRTEHNKDLAEANRQMEVIASRFIDDPEPFFEERKKVIAKAIEKYGDLQRTDLENGIISKKDYSLRLVNAVCKPFVPKKGTHRAHTATTITMTSDFYWEEIVMPLNDRGQFIPNIHHLMSLLCISHRTFMKYMAEGSEDLREACEMVRDRFIAYYQQRGMEKAVSEVVAMFVLKTSFQQRENDTPPVQVNQITVSNDEVIKRFAKQHGFPVLLDED